MENLTPVGKAALGKSLDDYFAALAAITKAQDRADFDTAAGKASAAVGGLVQSGAAASGVAAATAPLIGSFAKASSNAALWLVGQELDYRRLQQLRIATNAACEPVHTVAAAINIILEQQRGDRLDGLDQLLQTEIQAVNRVANPHATDAAYGAALDEAQSAADTFQAVRITDPAGLMQAIVDSHDQLVEAVRNNDGEFTQLIASLTVLGQRTNDLLTAATAKPATATKTGAKSS